MVEHINYQIVEKTRPMMYKIMKYWGGKPHNIFREHIEHYSNPNEIVLDAFSGRGVCPLEAIQVDRKAIAVDRNPVATYLTIMIATPLDIKKFEAEWKILKDEFRKFEQKGGIYLTKCTSCGSSNARVVNVHYEDKPYLVVYKCSCRKRGYRIKDIDKDDLKLIQKTEKLKFSWWYPNDKFPDTEAFDSAKKFGSQFSDLWTKRNLYILSYLYHRIKQIKDSNLREFFRFAFISMLHLCTKMVSARRQKSQRMGSGSWGRPAYMVLERHLEQNPFVLYERAIEGNHGVIKGKISSNELINGKVKFANDFEDLAKKDKNMLILNKNTVELTDFIPEESVDYVLTDPPYGGLIKYFELSSLWAVWLKGENENDDFKIPYNEEITLDRDRKFDYYDNLLLKSFTQINKVLKQGKYMTVTFHNKSIKIFNSIIRACINSGFVFENLLLQQNRRASESGVAHPWGTAIGDFYLRFRKPTKDEKKKTGLNRGNFENMVVHFTEDVIAERNQPTEMIRIITGVISRLYSYGQFFELESEDEIEQILRKRLGKEFVVVKSGLKKGDFWWFSEKEQKRLKLDLLPLSDRLENSIIQTFLKMGKVSYDDFLQTIFKEFPNALTPDYDSINALLKEHGERTSDKKWILKPNYNIEKGRHIRMINLLAKIGKKLGYHIWCPNKNEDKELRNICENIFPLKLSQSDRIKEIDVLWIKDGKIHYSFEVENSSSITSALVRGSNLPDREFTKKVIVLPEERMALLNRKMKEPMFGDYFKKDKWKIILYNELEKTERKRNITIDDFDKLFSIKVKSEKQITLS